MQTPPPSTPTRAARRPAWPIAPALIVVVLGALYLRTLAPGVTWANEAADSGDLIAAAATLGVAHPSGYPAYLLLARLFMLLPIGDLAFRAGLLSVAAGLGAALGVYAAVRALAAVPGWRGEVASAGAALICGLAPMLWSQAVVAEVYALNAMFVALLLWFIAEPARTRRALAARGLVAGLALGNHLTSGLVVAAWLVAALARAPGGLAPRKPAPSTSSKSTSGATAPRALAGCCATRCATRSGTSTCCAPSASTSIGAACMAPEWRTSARPSLAPQFWRLARRCRCSSAAAPPSASSRRHPQRLPESLFTITNFV
ncbi:protein O-mannosyl-transferase family [Kouleothrix sp.]|uniref:protein O-mannosyl-transferase family n=1 Tax=Kouleothrix sp. TaxID=2779161 RepID=UPI0039197D18